MPLYTHKFNNLDEMDQLLKTHKLLQFTGYQIRYLNITVTIKEIKYVPFKSLKVEIAKLR